MSNNNLYNYKTPKSGNEETGFFNIKGRINRKTFFLRWLLAIIIYTLCIYCYLSGLLGAFNVRIFIFFETISLFILPFLIVIFNLIQGAKRMHDVNKSGWYFLIPIYNIYLIFSPGTIGNNDFGIDPTPVKNIQFFDELDSKNQHDSKDSANSASNSNPDKRNNHFYEVKKQHPNKTDDEVLEIAQDSYNSLKQEQNTSNATTKKKLNKYWYLFSLVIAGSLYYFIDYEPKHRDTDNDSIADVMDDCPNDYGLSQGSVCGCPDSDSDGVADKIDSCLDKAGNETDGCFYYKKVTFKNNTRKKAHLSIAYKHENEWICEGWYTIESDSNYNFILPRYFKDKEVFWFADNESGVEWAGYYRYFWVAKWGNSGFKVRNGRFENKGGGRGVKKGFLKLDLTDENTYIGFND